MRATRKRYNNFQNGYRLHYTPKPYGSSEDAEFLSVHIRWHAHKTHLSIFDLGFSFYIADLRNYGKTATFRCEK